MDQDSEDQLSIKIGVIEAVARGKFSICVLVVTLLVAGFATLLLGLSWKMFCESIGRSSAADSFARQITGGFDFD